MTQTPSAASLVERFKLVERGRERGREGQPHASQPTLDNVEMEVAGYCDDLYAQRRNEYHRHRSALEERMRAPPADHRAGPQVENACKEMRDAVAEERPELAGLAREAQHAIGEVNRFRLAEGREADADFPESRGWHWGILVALVLLETLVNGLFFGANVEGGLLAGTTYAVLISVVNVGVIGWLIAAMLRLVHHRDPRRKVAGLSVVVAVSGVALFWNLFVAHYREALPPDYPPPPDATMSAQAGSGTTPDPPVAAGEAPAGRLPDDRIAAADPEPGGCWRGPDESHADQEALCLFRASPFGLNGFHSYMLLLIGIAMCVAAAMDWFKTDDPYPGYGRRERHRRRTEERLLDDRRELLGHLNELHDGAARKLRGDFRDPVEERRLALDAFGKLRGRYTDLADFARDLGKSCRGALHMYRTANREARTSADAPEIWQTPWKADWDLPDPPREADLAGEEEAAARGREMHAALEKHERTLRDCHEECRELVNELARLDPHHKAIPA